MKYKILILILITFASCESKIDDKLKFTNMTKKEIFVKVSLGHQFIDSLLNNCTSNLWIAQYSSRHIKPDLSEKFPVWVSWESFIENSADKKVCFYVFGGIAFGKFRRGEINKTRLKYKQLDFTKEQLVKLNWEVVFRDSI